MRKRLLAIGALALIGCASASAGTFQVGIVDNVPVPSATSVALGSTIQRYDVVWSPGMTTYTGTLELAADTRPVVAVYGPEYNGIPRDEVGRQQFASWLRSVLVRYPAVHDVIVGNEVPPKWWPYYPPLLQVVSPLIHSFGARVIGPGAHPVTPLDDHQPLINAIAAAGPHLLDVWDQHGYWTNFPAVITQVRAAFGWPIPFWVSEDGIDTVPDPAFAYMYTGSMPPDWQFWTTDDGQAEIVSKFMTRAYCAGASVWMNYLLRDEVDLSRWQSGLEFPNGSPKPAFAAFANLAHATARGAVSCADESPPAVPGTTIGWGDSRPHTGPTAPAVRSRECRMRTAWPARSPRPRPRRFLAARRQPACSGARLRTARPGRALRVTGSAAVAK